MQYSLLSDRHKQATAKMLDCTGNTIANKTERSQSGMSRLLIAKFDKIKSGHFPPNVFRFCQLLATGKTQ